MIDTGMARGWESKDVESQIEERLASRGKTQRELSPEEVARERKREGLMLSRVRVLADLERARSPRHRAMVEEALAHLDKQLAELR